MMFGDFFGGGGGDDGMFSFGGGGGFGGLGGFKLQKPKIWEEDAFTSEFCGHFAGDIMNATSLNSCADNFLKSVKYTQKHLNDTVGDGKMATKASSALKAMEAMLERCIPLVRKVESYRSYGMEFHLSRLIGDIVNILNKLEPGQWALLPLIAPSRDTIIMLVEFPKKRVGTSDTFNVTIINPSVGTQYHPKVVDASNPSKIKQEICLQLSPIPKSKLCSEGWWACAYLSSGIRSNEDTLYTHFLAWLTNRDFEGSIAEQHTKAGFATPAKSDDIVFWKALVHTMKFMLHKFKLDEPEVKHVRHMIKEYLCDRINTDLDKVKTVRFRTKKSLECAIEESSKSLARHSKLYSPAQLEAARKKLEALFNKVKTKPCDDEAVTADPPELDITSGWDKTQQPDSYPLFECFRRLESVDQFAGQKTEIVKVTPLNLFRVPAKFKNITHLIDSLTDIMYLLTRLSAQYMQDAVKNPALLVSSLLAQLVIEAFPAPLGPESRKKSECMWATPLLYAQQLLLLKRLHELTNYYAWSVTNMSDTEIRMSTRVCVLGKLAAIADLVMRTPPTDTPSLMTTHLNGTEGRPGYCVSPPPLGEYTKNYAFHYPEALVTRAEVLDYYEEVTKAFPATNIMWKWEEGSKIKDQAADRFWKQICKDESWPGSSAYYYGGTGDEEGQYCVVDRFFTEFKYFRNITVMFKGFLADDTPYESTHLQDLPYDVKANANSNMNYNFVNYNGSRWDLKVGKPAPSIATASYHTHGEVFTEDDLLHIRNLPTFNDVMGQRDSELLMSYLTAPYLRIPLVLRFFATEDRLSCLKDDTIQNILSATLFEPAKFMPASLAGQIPEEVPAENPDLLATPYGLLINELQNSPAGVLEPLTKLVLLAKETDAGTVKNELATKVILFLVRIVARADSYLSFVIDEINGAGKVHCARRTPVAPENVEYLTKSQQELRHLIDTQLLPMLEAWVNEAMDNVLHASKRQDIDEATQLACKLHYHIILLVRNVAPANYEPNYVSLLLSSFFFLTTRYTWENDDDEFNETELYDIFQKHRRPIAEWLYKSPVPMSSGVMDSVVRVVTSAGQRTEGQSFEWGVVAGLDCAGKYTRLDEELLKRAGRGDGLSQLMTCLDRTMGIKSISNGMKSVRVGLQDVEINLNTISLTFKAAHLRALPSEIAHTPDVMTVFGHLFDNNVNMMETMQCAVVEDATNRLWVRLVGQEHDVQYWKTPDPRLAIPSDTMRFFPDDLESSEEWLFPIFEPLRQRYFQRSFFQPPIFILLPENKLGPDNNVAKLEAVCSASGEKLKEIIVFKDTGVVHVYDMVSHGRRFYRQLVYTTDVRFTLEEMHPGGSGLGAGNPDPDYAHSQRETAVILRHPTHPENKSRSTETFIPRRLLKGLMPSSLLETHMFWQDEDDNLRGYPINEKVKDEDGNEDKTQKHKHMLWIHWRELQFDAIGQKNTCVQVIRFAEANTAPRASEQAVLKSQQMHLTDEIDEEMGMIRTDTNGAEDLEDDPADLQIGMFRQSSVVHNPKGAATVEDLNLLLVDLMYAREGTPLYSLAQVLARIEFLSHVLVWTTKTDYESDSGAPMSLDLVHLPRLKLSFRAKLDPDGKNYLLYSLDHAHLFVSNLRQALVTELLQGIPHSLILTDTNNAISILVPALQPFRSESGAFSTAIRVDRQERSWYNHLDTRYYLYPVHISLSFMFTPTLASALYLLLLRLMNRRYTDVFRLVANIGTDMEFTREEHQIFEKLGTIWDSHPDCNACRAKISLHVADSPVPVDWYTPRVVADMIMCLNHVSVACRMTIDEEARLLSICDLLMKKLKVLHDVKNKNDTGFRYAQSVISAPLDMTPAKRRQGKAFLNQLATALREKLDLRMSHEDMGALMELYGKHGSGEFDTYFECLLRNRKAVIDAEVEAAATGKTKVTGLTLKVPELGKDDRWLFWKNYDPHSVKFSVPMPLPKNSDGMNVQMSPTYDYWYCGKSGVREKYGVCRCQQCDENCGEYTGCPCTSCEAWNKANLHKMRLVPKDMDYDVRNNKLSFIDAFSMIKDVMNQFQGAEPFKPEYPYLQKRRPASLREGGYHHFMCFYEILSGLKKVRISKSMDSGLDIVQLIFPYMYEARNHHCGLGHVMHWLLNTPQVWSKLPPLNRKSKTRTQEMYNFLNGMIKKVEGHPAPVSKMPKVKLPHVFKLDIVPRPNTRTAEIPLDVTTILPIPHDTSCNKRYLSIPQMGELQLLGDEAKKLTITAQDLDDLADQPLRAVLSEGLVTFANREEQGLKPVSDELPFDLAKHPDASKTVAREMLARIEEDTKEFANKQNHGKQPRFFGIVSEQANKALVNSSQAQSKLDAILNKLSELHSQLLKIREGDSQFVAYALPAVLRTAHYIPLGTAAGTLMHLRRYGKQEAVFTVDFLVASLCSTTAYKEWMQLNPFLNEKICKSIESLLTLAILRANRIGHINRVCESVKELSDLLKRAKESHSAANKLQIDAAIASMSQKANSLAGQLVVKRVFIDPKDKGYDPRFMLFEFTWNLVLRNRQHELILDMYGNITNNQSIVKQMIMGAGKTTVVGPVLSLMLADGNNLVIQVVPPALLDFSRAVMRTTFSSVLQKQIFTFVCDRTTEVDSEVLSKFEHAKKCRGIVVTTPSSIKSIFLKYIEVLHHVVDPGRQRSVAMEKEAQDNLRILQMWQDAVLIMDEVDMLLHPLKSELNFPIGPKFDIDFTPLRWKLPIHLLDAIYYYHTHRITTQVKESPEAHKILDRFRDVIRDGLNNNALQEMPHLILLNTEFFEKKMKPVLAEWLLLFIKGQHMVGLTDAETLQYIQKRPTKKNDPDFVAKVEALEDSHKRLLNLSFEWLNSYICHVLQKIDRVSFGIMSSDDMRRARQDRPDMPRSRFVTAIPFVGKDMPSQSSEFAHPDVVIGLTILAYRYEGLRKSDFVDIMREIHASVEKEVGRFSQRRTCILYNRWVAAGGGKLLSSYNYQKAKVGENGDDDEMGMQPTESLCFNEDGEHQQLQVLPLKLMKQANDDEAEKLFKLFRRTPEVIHWYLCETIFPEYMRHQHAKLSASGQELGGNMLFQRRIGFSGTPSSLLPVELGQCGYEPGTDGQLIHTLTSPHVVNYTVADAGWTVRSLLDFVGNASPPFHALIDTGALITGMSNLQVAQYLLKHGLPQMEGVVFLDELDRKMILVRATGRVLKLAECGIPKVKRFAFYDQVHTTGMDIDHTPNAQAVQTLGKDMTFRDFSQGAYRMRGISQGQTIHLLIIPEVFDLINKVLFTVRKQMPLDPARSSPRTPTVLVGVTAWLLLNSIRSEHIQHNQLRIQSSTNVWRKEAYKTLVKSVGEFKVSTKPPENVMKALNVFNEPVSFDLPLTVPQPRLFSEALESFVTGNEDFIVGEGKTVISSIIDEAKREDEIDNPTIDVEMVQEQEEEREQEQEQEKEQEIEIEKFVDLAYSREEEAYVPWKLDSLRSLQKSVQFYKLEDFHLYKRRALSFPDTIMLSQNYYKPGWSGHRRMKNVIVTMEWVPELKSLAVRNSPSNDYVTIDKQIAQNHLKRTLEIVKEHQGELSAELLKELLLTALHFADASDPDWAALLSTVQKGGTAFHDIISSNSLRSEESGRFTVALTLMEAETIRRVIHIKKGLQKPFIDGAEVGVRLNIAPSNNAPLDASFGFQPNSREYQTIKNFHCLRFFDSDLHYSDPEIGIVLRSLHNNTTKRRQTFFQQVIGCRRRARQRWEKAPIALIFLLENAFTLLHQRAVGLCMYREIINERDLNLGDSFVAFNSSGTGILSSDEVWGALRWCRLNLTPTEVLDFIDIADSQREGSIQYPDYLYVLTGSRELEENETVDAPNAEDMQGKKLPTVPPYGLAEIKKARQEREARLRAEEDEAMKEMEDENRRVFEEIEAEQIREELEQLQTSLNPQLEKGSITFNMGEDPAPKLTSVANSKAFRYKDLDSSLSVMMTSDSLLRVSLRALKHLATSAQVTQTSSVLPSYIISAEVRFPPALLKKRSKVLRQVIDMGGGIKLAQWSLPVYVFGGAGSVGGVPFEEELLEMIKADQAEEKERLRNEEEASGKKPAKKKAISDSDSDMSSSEYSGSEYDDSEYDSDDSFVEQRKKLKKDKLSKLKTKIAVKVKPTKKAAKKKPAKKMKKRRYDSDDDSYDSYDESSYSDSDDYDEETSDDESYDGEEDIHIFKQPNPQPRPADVVGVLESGRENVRLSGHKVTTAFDGVTYEWTKLADPTLDEGWVVSAVDGKRLFRELSCTVYMEQDGRLKISVSEAGKAKPPFANILNADQDPDLQMKNLNKADQSDSDSDDDSYDEYDSYSDDYGDDDDPHKKPELGADVKDLMSAIKRARQLGRGDRVKRNPEEWQHGEDDGGDGSVGVVTKVDDDTVEVLWPNGKRDTYNWGKGGLFELIRVAKLPDGELFIDRVISNDERWGADYNGRDRKWTCDNCYQEFSPLNMYRCNHCERVVSCRKCFSENFHNNHDFTEMKCVIKESAKNWLATKAKEEDIENMDFEVGCEVEVRYEEKGVAVGTRGIIDKVTGSATVTVKFGKKSVKISQSNVKITAAPKKDPMEDFDMDQIAGQEIKPKRLNALNAVLGNQWLPGLATIVNAGTRTTSIVAGDIVSVRYKRDCHPARVRCLLKDGRYVVSELKGTFTIATPPGNMEKTFAVGSVVRFKRKVTYPNYGWGNIPDNQRYTMRLRVNSLEARSDFILLNCAFGRDSIQVDTREVEAADATKWLMYLKGKSSPDALPTSANMIVDGAYTSGEKRVRFIMAKRTFLVQFPSGEIFDETPGSIDLENSIGVLEAIPARPFKEPRKMKQFDDGHWHLVSLFVKGNRITGLCDGKKIEVYTEGLFCDEVDCLRDEEKDEDLDDESDSDSDKSDWSEMSSDDEDTSSEDKASNSGSSKEEVEEEETAASFYPLSLGQPLEVFHSTSTQENYLDNYGGRIESTYPRRLIKNFRIEWDNVDFEKERERHLKIEEDTRWRCTACGLLNSRQLDECEDCEEPRIAVVENDMGEKKILKVRVALPRSREMDHVRHRLQNKLRQRYQQELDTMDNDPSALEGLL